MQPEGKKIVMTGSTGGIGAPLVAYLEKAGGQVLSIDRKIHGDLVTHISDISSVVKNFQPDIIIHMAGYNQFDVCEQQDFTRLLDVNLKVPLILTQAVLPHMKQQGSGQIITVGSMMGLIPLPYFGGYIAAKAGLKAFSDSLRRELVLCKDNGHKLSIRFPMKKHRFSN